MPVSELFSRLMTRQRTFGVGYVIIKHRRTAAAAAGWVFGTVGALSGFEAEELRCLFYSKWREDGREAGFSSGLLYVCLTSDKTWLTRANEVGRAQSSFADEALIRLDAIWSRHLTALRLVP